MNNVKHANDLPRTPEEGDRIYRQRLHERKQYIARLERQARQRELGNRVCIAFGLALVALVGGLLFFGG